MKFAPYLENKQPLVWNSFLHALEHKRLNHAYLLVGESGSPLMETAIFLAKSLICDHPSPLADEECRTCTRIDHRTYSDIIILDGAEKTIKKEEVKEILQDFTSTPLEEKNTMIYIINLVENMTVEAVNSLLKFLEEPTSNTYAFLTTENVAKVLPTIVSRCETMRMLLSPYEEVVQECLEMGIPREDAELLAYFENSGNLVKARMEEKKEYEELKDDFVTTMEILSRPRDEAIFRFETEIVNRYDKREKGRIYLDLLSIILKDAIALKEKREGKLTTYVKLIQPLADKLPHLEDSLLEVMKARGQLNLNISVGLTLEHVINYLTKGS
ncbi:MAG: hypothetical protein K5694_06985 [Bacilli bacterium]|nr:hypothetical protein [Bacilli bacterium]